MEERGITHGRDSIDLFREGRNLIPEPLITGGGRNDLLNLGKYGMRALNYLKENEPSRYKTLYRFGLLA